MTAFKKLEQYIFAIVCVTIVWFTPLLASAQEQTTAEPAANPIKEAIETATAGTVTVEMPDDILQLILNGAPTRHTRRSDTPGNQTHKVGKMRGWRIQVFSDGRNPSTLGARARARGNAIAARFPKYRGQVYTFSTSPNWYTRIGNFRTASEANAALVELKRAFPAFAAEMRTVQCTVILR